MGRAVTIDNYPKYLMTNVLVIATENYPVCWLIDVLFVTTDNYHAQFSAVATP